ncbi:hypothetical protein [Flindersiella endophytica]
MSAAANPRTQVPRQHGDCLRDAVGGWRVCLTSGRTGITVAAAAADRIRVVLCRPASGGNRPSVARHVRLAAARLLWAGLSVSDSLDSLRVLLSRRGQPDGAVLVAVDLFVTGQVELARWGSAVVRQVTTEGEDNVVAGPLNVLGKVADRDWLAATPEPGELTGGLPRALVQATHPCEVRDRLVLAGLAGTSHDHAPPLVLANRVARAATPA